MRTATQRRSRRPRRPRRDRTERLTNKRMNDAVYAERRKVMHHVYEARDLLRSVGIDMPRVQIRICERDPHILGVARLGGDLAIWISESVINMGERHLRHTVFHELAHTLFQAPHKRGCPLMRPIHPRKPDLEQGERVFLELAKAYHS